MSIALDSDNRPHISYHKFGDGDLKYAWWNGSAWNITTVHASPTMNIGHHTSIALDSDGHRHISYGSLSTGDLNYATTSDMIPPNIGSVSQDPPEDNVLPTDEVEVNATVSDDLSGVKRVALNYTNGNGTWIVVDMTNIEGDVCSGIIPYFPYTTQVTYVIEAEDNANNTITTEDLGYEYEYYVIPEFSSLFILPLFMIASLLAVIVYEKGFQCPNEMMSVSELLSDHLLQLPPFSDQLFTCALFKKIIYDSCKSSSRCFIDK